MKKLKEFLSASKTNVAIFAVSSVLVVSATIGAASAAIAYLSTQIEMNDIGVSLIENGESISWRNYDRDDTWNYHTGILLEHMIDEGERVELGRPYTEELTVTNSGTIDEFVRVSIYRYWIDPSMEVSDDDDSSAKQLNLACDLIDLHLVNLDSYWLLDQSASTNERTVLYYNRVLPSGETAPLFSDTLIISSDAAADPAYDGKKFIVRVDVDAVQTHNAEAAILSAWGRNVRVDGDMLYLS